MNKKKDIFVIKGCFNTDYEKEDLIKVFSEQFEDDAIVLLTADNPDESEAYWASRNDNVYINSETDFKQGIKLVANEVEYDEETDTYIYHTGISINLVDDSNCVLMINPGESDAFLTENILPINGEIILRYKNRTTWPVLVMFKNWEFIMEATNGVKIDENKLTSETVLDIKRNVPRGPETPKPLDYAPFEIGEVIGTAYIIKLANINQKEELPKTD